jgi:serine/threonine protein phosphatase 1
MRMGSGGPTQDLAFTQGFLIQKALPMKVTEETTSVEGRLFAIGDIHGCSTALRTLIETIHPSPEDTIVILGDFIDCGPDSKGVVDQLIALSARCQLVTLLGNHEEMLLNALESKSEFSYWMKFGGKHTLESYSPNSTDINVIPADHIRFIRSCRDYFETETHIFVHANYDPDLPMNQLSDAKLRWDALDVARLRPHCSGKTVVVGHTPQANGNVLDLGFLIGIDTDCCRVGWLTGFSDRGNVVQTDESGAIRSSAW